VGTWNSCTIQTGDTTAAAGANSRPPTPPPALCVFLPSHALSCIDIKKKLPPSLPFEACSASKAPVDYTYRATTELVRYVWKYCLQGEFGHKCHMYDLVIICKKLQILLSFTPLLKTVWFLSQIISQSNITLSSGYINKATFLWILQYKNYVIFSCLLFTFLSFHTSKYHPYVTICSEENIDTKYCILSLRRADPSSRGVLPTVVCVWVWSSGNK
jgi:hypothetical protein